MTKSFIFRRIIQYIDGYWRMTKNLNHSPWNELERSDDEYRMSWTWWRRWWLDLKSSQTQKNIQTYRHNLCQITEDGLMTNCVCLSLSISSRVGVAVIVNLMTWPAQSCRLINLLTAVIGQSLLMRCDHQVASALISALGSRGQIGNRYNLINIPRNSSWDREISGSGWPFTTPAK